MLGDLGHVELVVDVAVEPEARGLDGDDRLARELERNRLVQEEAAARLGDDGALVADDGILLEAEFGEVRPYRPEHAPGDDDEADSRLAHGGDGCERARAQEAVLPDQGPVEVASERRDVAREVVREVQLPATLETYAATFWMSWSSS